MVRVFGVDLAPLSVPLERRLQTLSAIGHSCCTLVLPWAGGLFLVLLLTTRVWFVPLGYLVYVYYDKCIAKTSKRGGRRSELVRRLKQVKYLQEYFPMKMFKTADLDPDRNYVMGFHPHGILGIGSFVAACSEYIGFSDMFPGIKCTLLTLTLNLTWPITREYGLMMGIRDVDKETIDWMLTEEGTGNALVLVVGGAEEALESRPGSHVVILEKRTGFIRHAIRHGASLVPIYSFGETDLYEQVENPEGSPLRSLQTKLKKLLSFSPPVFYGRGVFNYTFGMLPRRVPVNIVVGHPIHTTRDPSPTRDVIAKYHNQYKEALAALFEEHKTKYGVAEDVHLVIK